MHKTLDLLRYSPKYLIKKLQVPNCFGKLNIDFLSLWYLKLNGSVGRAEELGATGHGFKTGHPGSLYQSFRTKIIWGACSSPSEERSSSELVPVPQKKGLLGSLYQSFRRNIFQSS